MPKEISTKAEEYALKAVLSGAESYIEDDLDEDEEFPDNEAEHRRAVAFGYSLLHAVKYHRSQLLTTAREHYASKSE